MIIFLDMVCLAVRVNISVVLMCEILEVAAVEVVGSATHRSSLPPLAEPGAARNVLPVPPPRSRKSCMYREQECGNNSDNCMSSIRETELFISVDLGSRKAKSSEDIQTQCTKADPCICENNNIQATGFGSSVDDGSDSVGCTLTEDTCIAVSTSQGSVKLPVKPVRRKQAKKESVESTDGSDVISVPKIETVDECESSTAREDKGTFPEPKPRMSLLRKSIALYSDEADQVGRKLWHNEPAVQNDAETLMHCAKGDIDSPIIVPINIACDVTKDKVNDAEHCRKLNDYTDSNEQNRLKVQSDVSVAVQRSSVFVPSRAAPSPPLPTSQIITHSTSSVLPSRVAPPPPVRKPKIRTHSSGSSKVVKCSCNGDISQDKASSDSDNTSDSIQTSTLSGKTVTERNQQQPESNKLYSPDSLPPGDPKSNDSSDVLPASTSNVHSSEASSTTMPAAVEGCKLKVPVVPRKRKPVPACRRSLDISTDIKKVNSYIPDTHRQSENVVHGNFASSLHSLTSDAADHSSPKPYPQQEVISGFASLSLTDDNETAADVQQNSSPRENCSSLADTDFVFDRSSLEPLVSPLDVMSPDVFVADTPPITPAVFRYDANDVEAQMVCCFYNSFHKSIHP